VVDDLPSTGRELPFLVQKEETVLFGEEEPGGDGHHPDRWRILLGHVHRQPLGEVGHRRLGGRVSRDAGQGPDGVHGGDVQDPP